MIYAFQLSDGLFGVWGVEDAGAGDEHVGTGVEELRCIIGVYSAVHFDECV